MRPLLGASLLLFGLAACQPKAKYPNSTADFRPEMRRWLDSIATPGELPYEDSTGLAFLRKQCSVEELVRLMECDVPLLRVVAYQTIVARDEPKFFDLLCGHLSDSAMVTNWDYDDASGVYQASDMMIRAARKHEAWTEWMKDSLVSLVLGNHRYLQHAYWMIEDIEPQERYYPVVRGEALKPLGRCNKERALLALAKFNKSDDLDLIRTSLLKGEDVCTDWGFKAVETFPDESLFVVLENQYTDVITKKKQWSYNDLRLYCRALVAFKDARSARILSALTQGGTYPDPYYLPHNKKYVYLAINRNRAAVYDSLFNALRPEMDSITIAGHDFGDIFERRTW